MPAYGYPDYRLSRSGCTSAALFVAVLLLDLAGFVAATLWMIARGAARHDHGAPGGRSPGGGSTDWTLVLAYGPVVMAIAISAYILFRRGRRFTGGTQALVAVVTGGWLLL